ncbi:MAG TPA: hypothetical protein VMB50_10900 [Myxococcales bacterium]|nr:hypothetical protein [Myxococcales bacterium]
MKTWQIVVALAWAGCASPARVSGFLGGYEEVLESPGVYRIEAVASGSACQSILRRYALRRALELCGRDGYASARVTRSALSAIDRDPVQYRIDATAVCLTTSPPTQGRPTSGTASPATGASAS